jgi:hypothetical protein
VVTPITVTAHTPKGPALRRKLVAGQGGARVSGVHCSRHLFVPQPRWRGRAA